MNIPNWSQEHPWSAAITPWSSVTVWEISKKVTAITQENFTESPTYREIRGNISADFYTTWTRLLSERNFPEWFRYCFDEYLKNAYHTGNINQLILSEDELYEYFPGEEIGFVSWYFSHQVSLLDFNHQTDNTYTVTWLRKFDTLYLNPFFHESGRDLIAWMEHLWGLEFSESFVNRFFEIGRSFDKRYGNGIASASRYLFSCVNMDFLSWIFVGNVSAEEALEKIALYEPKTDIIRLFQSILVSFLQRQWWGWDHLGYKRFVSWQSPRDKSCKDAESYFLSLLTEPQWEFEHFQIIGDFIEKNLHKSQPARTAVNYRDVWMNGIKYPRGCLFRLNTRNDAIVSVEPIRITEFAVPHFFDSAHVSEHPFWSQHKETLGRMKADDFDTEQYVATDVLDFLRNMLDDRTLRDL